MSDICTTAVVCRVKVHLYSQSKPVVIDNVRNAYTKDGLYCVMAWDGVVQKFPLVHIFRIEEQI